MWQITLRIPASNQYLRQIPVLSFKVDSSRTFWVIICKAVGPFCIHLPWNSRSLLQMYAHVPCFKLTAGLYMVYKIQCTITAAPLPYFTWCIRDVASVGYQRWHSVLVKRYKSKMWNKLWTDPHWRGWLIDWYAHVRCIGEVSCTHRLVQSFHILHNTSSSKCEMTTEMCGPHLSNE